MLSGDTGVGVEVSGCQVQGVGGRQFELQLFAVHLQDSRLQQATLTCESHEGKIGILFENTDIIEGQISKS